MNIRVSDEVWVATALLHRENPGRDDFAVAEIVARAEQEDLTGRGRLRPGVRVHVSRHCVANKPPDPGRYRMLLETRRARRRLFRPGDPQHPERAGGRIAPEASDLPPAYRELLEWYEAEYVGAEIGKLDPVLSLRGVGKEIWIGETADAYVARLREGWE